jgi:hypothetical protein
MELLTSDKTGTGKPLFKASDGGVFENLWVTEDITQIELQQSWGMKVLTWLKVRPEAFPNGLPMSV